MTQNQWKTAAGESVLQIRSSESGAAGLILTIIMGVDQKVEFRDCSAADPLALWKSLHDQNLRLIATCCAQFGEILRQDLFRSLRGHVEGENDFEALARKDVAKRFPSTPPGAYN